jgi:membrane-bound lytic murein transglycosylase D
MSKKHISTLFLLFGFSAWAGQPHGENDTLKTKTINLESVDLKDDPFAAKLDSLLSLNFFVDESDKLVREGELSGVDLAKDSLYAELVVSDSIYQMRLERLNERTPLNLVYNPTVKSYIELYSQRRREQVSRMLGLAQYYFPLFEATLDKYDMPLEIKYLAVVESALNPLARSRVGATGLWQFMYATGKLNNLNVTSYTDDRSDPIKSTEAACQYLTKLYGIFGDWDLALAAYNSGPGNVNKAIRRSGGLRNYWSIRPFLPRETAGYVPAFIAVNYIMNHAEDHFIYPTEVKPSFFQLDTVLIKEKISFSQISKLIDMSEDDLSFLNPSYRYKVIPKISDNYCHLVLPSSKIGLFIANEDSIYALAQKDFEVNKPKEPTYVNNERVRHRVQRGEVLGTIAEKYGVGVSSIRAWNGLRGNTIRVGQYLTIYPRRMPTTTASAKDNSNSGKAEPAPDGSHITYKVVSGESFYSIARKYPGISAQNIMSWNNISSARSLKPGMVLKIYPRS